MSDSSDVVVCTVVTGTRESGERETCRAQVPKACKASAAKLSDEIDPEHSLSDVAANVAWREAAVGTPPAPGPHQLPLDLGQRGCPMRIAHAPAVDGGPAVDDHAAPPGDGRSSRRARPSCDLVRRYEPDRGRELLAMTIALGLPVGGSRGCRSSVAPTEAAAGPRDDMQRPHPVKGARGSVA